MRFIPFHSWVPKTTVGDWRVTWQQDFLCQLHQVRCKEMNYKHRSCWRALLQNPWHQWSAVPTTHEWTCRYQGKTPKWLDRGYWRCSDGQILPDCWPLTISLQVLHSWSIKYYWCVSSVNWTQGSILKYNGDHVITSS